MKSSHSTTIVQVVTTPVAVAGVQFYVRLSVSVLPHDSSITDAETTANLTQKCSKMSHVNRFILGSEGQMPRSQVTKTLPAWICVLL